MSGWQWTEDPDAPCALCVAWIEPPGWEGVDMAQLIPTAPDGATEDLVFVGFHEECRDQLDAHLAEMAAIDERRRREATT